MKARNIQTRAGGKHWLSMTTGNYQQKKKSKQKKSCNQDTHPGMGWTTWGYKNETKILQNEDMHAMHFF